MAKPLAAVALATALLAAADCGYLACTYSPVGRVLTCGWLPCVLYADSLPLVSRFSAGGRLLQISYLPVENVSYLAELEPSGRWFLLHTRRTDTGATYHYSYEPGHGLFNLRLGYSASPLPNYLRVPHYCVQLWSAQLHAAGPSINVDAQRCAALTAAGTCVWYETERVRFDMVVDGGRLGLGAPAA